MKTRSDFWRIERSIWRRKRTSSVPIISAIWAVRFKVFPKKQIPWRGQNFSLWWNRFLLCRRCRSCWQKRCRNTNREVTADGLYHFHVEQTEVGWIWYLYIPFEKLTIVQGNPGEGKTFFAMELFVFSPQTQCFQDFWRNFNV